MSLTDIFIENAPIYMSMGMSFNEYWYGDTWLVGVYKKAHELKKVSENQKLWLQGLYNYKAFSSVIEGFSYDLNGGKGKKPDGYLENPVPITELEKEWARQEKVEKTRKFFLDGQK